MLAFLTKLFDTEGFPPRWKCGTGWTSELGWLHIVSDIAIWASYTAIPFVLAAFVIRRRDTPFPRIFWLFIAFIFLCGTIHLIEAVIFWHPVYRLSSVVKLATAGVSVATVCALIPAIPRALSLRSPEHLERQVIARTKRLKESAERQQLLMSELDHRVKNNITAIMSLAEQTIASNRSMDDFREAFIGRLRAMARTHESLSRSKWAGTHLRTILDLTLDPYRASDNPRFTIDGPELLLDAKASNAMCLAIHELATNSVKYGSLSVPGGSIAIHWSIDEHGLRITWRERGGPAVNPPERAGFGTSLIQGMIAHELEGSVEIAYPSAGLVCDMILPSSRVILPISGPEEGPATTRSPS